jgi:hypothetical protein
VEQLRDVVSRLRVTAHNVKTGLSSTRHRDARHSAKRGFLHRLLCRPIVGCIALLGAQFGCCSDPVNRTTTGHFEPAEPELRLLVDGRNSRLLKSFAYVSGDDRWVAPEGEVVDGATIPRLFWSLIGGPYEGRYRFASIIHDRYCRVPNGRTWRQTHRMFYEACLAGGTDPKLAKLMYAAVYHFGPRWDDPPSPNSIGSLLLPEHVRIADELAQRSTVRLLATDPRPPETVYIDAVLAPRPPRLGVAEQPLDPALEKWDRIRAFVREHPAATLEQIEGVD